MAITKVHARQIFDSRGNPTVEVEVTTANGKHTRAHSTPQLPVSIPLIPFCQLATYTVLKHTYPTAHLCKEDNCMEIVTLAMREFED